MSELLSQPRSPNRFSRWFIHVFNPTKYHSIMAQERWQDLFQAKARRWLKAISGTRPENESDLEELMSWFESGLPNLKPMLSGTMQPADFVKHWVKSAGLPQDIAEKPFIRRARQRLEKEPERIKRWLFDLALVREDLYLKDMLRAADDRSGIQVGFLLAANLVVLAVLLWFGLSLDINLLTTMTNLEFASVLLIAPVASLFVSSQLIRSHHLRKSHISSQQTRLSSAMHAYKTYEDVQIIKERIKEKVEKRAKSQREYSELERDIKIIEAEGQASADQQISRVKVETAARLTQIVKDVGGQLSEAVIVAIIRSVFSPSEMAEQTSNRLEQAHQLSPQAGMTSDQTSTESTQEPED